MKVQGIDNTYSELLLAVIADRLGILAWQNTEDALKHRNVPESIYEKLLSKETTPQSDVVSFYSGEEFEEARKRILEGQ